LILWLVVEAIHGAANVKKAALKLLLEKIKGTSPQEISQRLTRQKRLTPQLKRTYCLIGA